MNVHTRWRERSDEQASIKWARELFAATAPHATGGVYVNFMPEDETDRVAGAYGGNYVRLGGAEGQIRSGQPVPAEPERPAEGVADEADCIRTVKPRARGGDLDIGQWLRDLGLQSYEQAFRDNGVDLDVLPRLTADDLKEIGVSAVGHRRKILDAVGELAAAQPVASRPQEFPIGPSDDTSR